MFLKIATGLLMIFLAYQLRHEQCIWTLKALVIVEIQDWSDLFKV